MAAVPPALKEAPAAKAKVTKLLAELPVVGIGETRVGAGYGVKVNLREGVEPVRLPAEADGVPIKAEVVGPISKR